MRSLQCLLSLRSLLCGAGPLSETAAFQHLPSLGQALQQLGQQWRGVKKQANEVGDWRRRHQQTSEQHAGGCLSCACIAEPPNLHTPVRHVALCRSVSMCTGCDRSPCLPQTQKRPPPFAPPFPPPLCHYLLQLRVGNVIEHQGKLLQVVSLQNRAMGVSVSPIALLPACGAQRASV